MGSLTTKSKPPVVRYVSVPDTSSAAPTTGSGATPADTGASDAAEAAAAAVRRHSLPETILTSFRGVLSPGDWVPQRKSLLGE